MNNEGSPTRRYKVLIEVSDEQLEQLTLARLLDLAEEDVAQVENDRLRALACRIYDTRRARAKFFQDSMLGEPVWDMLLALYCLQSRRQRLSVTGLCHAAGVPQTTGLRWSQLMEQKGLLVRERDPKDGRRTHFRLSEKGEQMMEAYLSAIYNKLRVE